MASIGINQAGDVYAVPCTAKQTERRTKANRFHAHASMTLPNNDGNEWIRYALPLCNELC